MSTAVPYARLRCGCCMQTEAIPVAALTASTDDRGRVWVRQFCDACRVPTVHRATNTLLGDLLLSTQSWLAARAASAPVTTPAAP